MFLFVYFSIYHRSSSLIFFAENRVSSISFFQLVVFSQKIRARSRKFEEKLASLVLLLFPDFIDHRRVSSIFRLIVCSRRKFERIETKIERKLVFRHRVSPISVTSLKEFQ